MVNIAALDEKDVKFLQYQKEKGVSADIAFLKLQKLKSERESEQKELSTKDSTVTTDAGQKGFGERFLENIGPKGLKEFVDFPVGAAKGVASTISGASELGQEIFEGAGEKILGVKAPQEKAALPKSLTEATTPEQQFGKAVEQISEFFAPIGTVAKLPKAVEATSLASKILSRNKSALNIVNNFLGNKPNLIAKTIKESAGVGMISALQEGDVSSGVQSGGITGAIGFGSGLVGRAAKGVSKFVAARAIPSTITQKGKDAFTGLDIGEAVSKLSPSLTRAGLTKKITEETKKLGGQLNDILERAVNKNKTQKTIDDVLSGVEKEILSEKNFKKLKATPIDIPKVRETVKEVINDYKKLYTGKAFNEKDLQALKVALGDGLESEFGKAVGATIRTKPLTEMKIRANIQTMLEDLAPDVKPINEKLAPLFEAKKRLSKKGSYSGYLTDLMAGGFYSGGADMVTTNPVGFFKNFLKGVIIKRAATSTASKTTTSFLLRKVDDLVNAPKFATAASAIGKQIFNQQ